MRNWLKEKFSFVYRGWGAGYGGPRERVERYLTKLKDLPVSEARARLCRALGKSEENVPLDALRVDQARAVEIINGNSIGPPQCALERALHSWHEEEVKRTKAWADCLAKEVLKEHPVEDALKTRREKLIYYGLNEPLDKEKGQLAVAKALCPATGGDVFCKDVKNLVKVKSVSGISFKKKLISASLNFLLDSEGVLESLKMVSESVPNFVEERKDRGLEDIKKALENFSEAKHDINALLNAGAAGEGGIKLPPELEALTNEPNPDIEAASSGNAQLESPLGQDIAPGSERARLEAEYVEALKEVLEKAIPSFEPTKVLHAIEDQVKEQVGDKAERAIRTLIAKKANTILMGDVLPNWADLATSDPKKRWEEFRTKLASQEYWKDISDKYALDARRHVALGSALRGILPDGSTAYIANADLRLTAREEDVQSLDVKNSSKYALDARRHVVALGSALSGILPDGLKTYIANAYLRLTARKEDVQSLDIQNSSLPGEDIQVTFPLGYIDWSKQTSGWSERPRKHHSFVLSGSVQNARDKETLRILLKTQLAGLSPGSKFRRAHFGRTEIEPILSWLRHEGSWISVSVNTEGLIGIAVGRADVAGRAEKSHADNVAIVMSHLVRSSLGDHVSGGEPPDKKLAYVIGPNEVLPVALDALPNLDISFAVDCNRKLIAEQILVELMEETGTLRARDGWGDQNQAVLRSAAIALVERGISRRNALISGVEAYRQFEGKKKHQFRAHTALLFAVSMLMGLFFGAALSETIFAPFDLSDDQLAERTIILLIQGLIVGAYGLSYLNSSLDIGFSKSRRSRNSRPAKSKFLPAFFSFVGSFFLSLSLASMPLDDLVLSSSETVLSRSEIGVLGVSICLISAILFLWFARLDGKMREVLDLSLTGSGHESITVEGNRSLQSLINGLHTEDRILFCVVLGFVGVFLLAIISLRFGISVSFLTGDGGGVQFRTVFENFAWAGPVLGFSALWSAWSRFGNTGMATLHFQLIQRRLKQVDTLIRNHIPLAEIFEKLNPDIRLTDIEKAANALAPHTELIAAEEARAESKYLRNTALGAALVLAALQIDAFKSFKPDEEKETPYSSDKWIHDTLAASFMDGSVPLQALGTQTHGATFVSVTSNSDIGTVTNFPKKDCASALKEVDMSDPEKIQGDARDCLDNGKRRLSEFVAGFSESQALEQALSNLESEVCADCSTEAAQYHRSLRSLSDPARAVQENWQQLRAELEENFVISDFHAGSDPNLQIPVSTLSDALLAIYSSVDSTRMGVDGITANWVGLSDAFRPQGSDQMEIRDVSEGNRGAVIGGEFMRLAELLRQIASKVQGGDPARNKTLRRSEFRRALNLTDGDPTSAEQALVDLISELKKPVVERELYLCDGDRRRIANAYFSEGRAVLPAEMDACFECQQDGGERQTFNQADFASALRERLRLRLKEYPEDSVVVVVTGLAAPSELPLTDTPLSKTRADVVASLLTSGPESLKSPVVAISRSGYGLEGSDMRRSEVRICSRLPDAVPPQNWIASD